MAECRPSLTSRNVLNHCFSDLTRNSSMQTVVSELLPFRSSSLFSNARANSPLLSVKKGSTCWSLKSVFSPTIEFIESSEFELETRLLSVKAGGGARRPDSGRICSGELLLRGDFGSEV